MNERSTQEELLNVKFTRGKAKEEMAPVDVLPSCGERKNICTSASRVNTWLTYQ